ncbi:hypothetical protein [Rhizobium binae]|uniref:hypothetical protein n=1 Tax=Rhizobium binae TaxID=1138190 RepID=UPI001C831BF4|nr:hypothetical protein [Rhizobium binae]MBX4971087.1 hypothetical protein [Rhizobium binae]
MDVVSLVKENWSVISQAPWVFVTLAALLGSGGFVVGRFLLSEKVSNLESRLATRDERIKDLESKISALDTEIAKDDSGIRQMLLGRFTSQYQTEKGGVSLRMKAGLELPPADWINSKLEELEEPWRVRNVRGRHCEIYDIASKK